MLLYEYTSQYVLIVRYLICVCHLICTTTVFITYACSLPLKVGSINNLSQGCGFKYLLWKYYTATNFIVYAFIFRRLCVCVFFWNSIWSSNNPTWKCFMQNNALCIYKMVYHFLSRELDRVILILTGVIMTLHDIWLWQNMDGSFSVAELQSKADKFLIQMLQ